MKNKPSWEYKEHFHAIGMTGDYDGHYEVTNGDISLCTNDDPEDITETENTLQRVAKSLNESECKFYCNTTTEHKLHIENMELRYKIDDLRDQAQRMADALDAWIKADEKLTVAINAGHVHYAAEHQGEAEKCMVVLKELLQQFKDGTKGKEVEVYRPCPHCGRELFRDRNLCCRACGREVVDAQ